MSRKFSYLAIALMTLTQVVAADCRPAINSEIKKLGRGRLLRGGFVTGISSSSSSAGLAGPLGMSSSSAALPSSTSKGQENDDEIRAKIEGLKLLHQLINDSLIGEGLALDKMIDDLDYRGIQVGPKRLSKTVVLLNESEGFCTDDAISTWLEATDIIVDEL